MNKIKDDYKDTEIGVIPNEWDVVSLGDVLEYEQPTKYLVETTDYDNSYSIPVLTAGKSFILGYTNETSGIYENLPAIIFDDFTTASKYVDFPFKAKSSAMKILKVRNKEYPTNLFYEYLNSVEFEAGTHKRYWISEYQNLKIPLPPLKEQEKIADILSTADDKIDAIASQIEKAETLKKGLLQKLLSEGIGHNEFKDSELGKIPLSWEVVKLGDISELTSSKRVHLADYVDIGIPFYRGKEITLLKKNETVDDLLYISEEQYNKIKNQFGIPKKNDILITAVGTLANTYRIPNDNPFYFKDGNLIWLKGISENSIFIDYILGFHKKQILDSAIGSSQKALTIKELKKVKIPLPPLEEQKQIADILSTADEKLEVLRAKKEKYETLKKGLLQKLLSGEVRV